MTRIIIVQDELEDSVNNFTSTADVRQMFIPGVGVEGDPYILIEGGIVQNDPILPVYNLDILEADVQDPEAVKEAFELYLNIHRNPEAAEHLGHLLNRIATWVRADADKAAIEMLESLEAAREES